MKTPDIPLAGVIGAPIAHSKSPLLHRHWLDTYRLKGFYVPMEVAADDLEQVLRTLPKAGFVGVNVTIPHKEAVLKIVDHVSERASRIGAANTITFRREGTIEADNTDGYGFLQNLREGAPDWRATESPALVLGAGGAARAVIVALLDAGVPQIILTNRTRVRAENLQSIFGQKIRVIDWQETESTLGSVGLIVNSSSLGMVGEPPLPMTWDDLRSDTVVTDLVYNPLRTALLEFAAARGCVTVDGLGMLLHQGVPGFTSWFGTRPDVTEATRRAVLA
ncbi:MAG: shikimate dehydrogenase [Roseobacter sp.]|jgi:shikimate dehydrogenase